MKKLFFAIMLLAAVILSAGYFSSSFAQNQVTVVQPNYVKGSVSRVNFIDKEVTVQFVAADGRNDEVTFTVTLNTQIIKKDLMMTLSQVKVGDEVIVEYFVNQLSFQAQQANRIRVKSPQEESSPY